MPRLHFPPRLPRFFGPLIAVALALAGCGGTASHRPAAANPAGLISIFESDQLLSTPARTLDQLRSLGVQYVRVMVRWRYVTPEAWATATPAHFDGASPGAYPAANWAPYDAIVRDAQARHIGVMFDITGGAPNWAMGPGYTPGGAAGVWRPSATAFGAFVRAVGTRYSGSYEPPGATTPLPRVSFWSIWNEPNLGEADLAPQAIDGSKVEVSPAMYRGLLDAGWAGLHQTGHGTDTILIGELAPYGQPSGGIYPGTFGYMVPLRFLRALYCVGSSLRPLQGSAAAARDCPTTATGRRNFGREHPALFQASGFAMHPYSQGALAPNAVLPIDDPDFIYLATISRLARFLDRVTALYGVAHRYPIYSTEYGYQTNPPFSGNAPVEVAAGYINWAEYLSWRNPRLRSYDQYLLEDPRTGGPSKFVTGLEYASGQRKPLFYAYRLPIYLPVTAQPHGRRLEVWGCVRPAHFVRAPAPAEIQLQRHGQGAFRTIQTVTVSGAGCYFDVVVRFPSGGIARLAWSYPRGPTIFSRTVAITTS